MKKIMIFGLVLGFIWASHVDAALYTFGRDLWLTVNSQDVMNLQKVLNSDPATMVSTSGAGAPGSETTYFGMKTQLAVARFQKKYGINPSAGYVGPMTRTKLNSLPGGVATVVSSIAPRTSSPSGSSSGSSGGSSSGSPGNSGNSSSGSNSGSNSAAVIAAAPPSAAPAAPSQTQPSAPAPTVPADVASRGNEEVCNTSLFTVDGYTGSRMVDKATCEKLNQLYKEGKAAGNVGDLYVNRDNLHVNFCNGWTPNPECPRNHRVFYQHDWQIAGTGAASSAINRVVLGQASYSGTVSGHVKHNIAYDKYRNQSGADQLHSLYASDNLYMYPALDDDVPTNPGSVNIANSPYVVTTRQLCDCGAGYLREHGASGSDLPFIELGFAGLAAFKPDVKQRLDAEGRLISTLQALIRYSHTSVGSDSDYLTSPVHDGPYLAHRLDGDRVVPAFNSGKLVDMANSLSYEDAPPRVELSVISENFTDGEKIFTTPGAISRSVSYNTSREITISVSPNEEVRFVVLRGDASLIRITEDSANRGRAKIELSGGNSTDRIDIGVFVKKSGGKYWSVPGIVSLYIHS